MEKRLYGLRGATGAANTKESVQDSVTEMCRRLFAENGIAPQDIVSVHFTQTKDLTALNPAFALRHGDVGIDVSGCALFTSQEADIAGAPDGMIRVLVHAYLEDGASPRHVYINGAERLRPDFVRK
ncbi:MAG: chorismate mutase [Treponemataceae bacterium]|nr:chorismate mutase [Treponemataceae bacterium]MDE7391742.1 chorismate mutase [Treponemataceae bacterium]